MQYVMQEVGEHQIDFSAMRLCVVRSARIGKLCLNTKRVARLDKKSNSTGVW